MALIGWWPLNGNTKDYSINKNHFEYLNNNGNIIISNNGKIGKSYKVSELNKADYFITSKEYLLPGDVSMSVWANIFDITTSANGVMGQHNHSTNSGLGITVRYIGSDDYRISCNTGTGSARTYHTYYGTSNIKNKWSLLTLTFEKATNIIKLYVNGNMEKEFVYDQFNVSDKFGLFTWSLNYNNNTNYRPAMELNDARLYDHVLSQKEINDLYKAKVLSYSFNLDNDIIYDNSGYKNNSFKVGNPIWNEDGSYSISENNYIRYENNPLEGLNEELTISIWAKGTQGVKSYDGLLHMKGKTDHNGGFIITRSGNNNTMRLRHWSPATNITWTSNIYNKMVNIVVTIKDKTIRIYEDGEFKVQGTSTSDFDLGEHIYLGWYENEKSFFHGKIYDFEIYTTILSDNEIMALYTTKTKLDKHGSLYIKNLLEDIRPEVYNPISIGLYNESSNLPDEDGFYTTTGGHYSGYIFNETTLKNGRTYKISFTYKSIENNNGWYTIANVGTATGGISYGSNKTLQLNSDGEIREHSFTITATKDHLISICLLRNGTQNGNVAYKNLKVIDITPTDIFPLSIYSDKIGFYKNGTVMASEFIESNEIDEEMKTYKNKIIIKGSLNEV